MILLYIFVRLPWAILESLAYRGRLLIRGIVANVTLRNRVRFNGFPILRGNIKWGKDVIVNSGFCSNLYGLFQRTIIYAYDGAEIVIGDNVGLSGVTLNSRERIEIGAGTLVGGNVKIIDHDFHPVDSRFRNPDITEKIGCSTVLVGEKCFIGGGAIITKGVHLGDCCVVGSGAVVVSGNYPEGSLIVGNPAKVVKIYPIEK